jgi:hypothetical protein
MKRVNQIKEWKDIPGYEGLYQASNLGNIKSLQKYSGKGIGHLTKEKILKQVLGTYGYFKIKLYKDGKPKTFEVHKLVCMAFLNHTPCGHELVVNHKDLNKQNNNVCNLELISQRENSNMRHIKTSSKYVGVCFYKRSKRWRAAITIGKLKKHIGDFKNEFDAHLAYQRELSKIQC